MEGAINMNQYIRLDAFYSRLEDAIDAFSMIFNGSDNGWLLSWTIANIFAVAVLSYACEELELPGSSGVFYLSSR